MIYARVKIVRQVGKIISRSVNQSANESIDCLFWKNLWLDIFGILMTAILLLKYVLLKKIINLHACCENHLWFIIYLFKFLYNEYELYAKILMKFITSEK